eukprot:TRINITY_DN19784_c0_g2_i1.p1 TRINITY_DN19784_c0_g2~~TRINITY_DN19784_c0_g2_i1.p1  ORF type:complete len:231 (+),score=93.77 TRINITY_DN19784_c0_g2_i1:102-695(+)
MPPFRLEETEEQAFLGACKSGDLAAVQQRIESGADPTQKGYVFCKGRLLGVKHSSDFGKFILTHQSGDRMMGSALHYAAISERHAVCAWLMAHGADADARLNTPPHMPHEATVTELAELNGNEVFPKMALVFKFWGRLPWDAPQRLKLLDKLPPEVADLKEELVALVERRRKEPPPEPKPKDEDSDDEFGLKKLGLA